MFKFLRDRRRRRLLKTALPDAWIDILEDRLTFVATLPISQRQRFFDHVNVFANEKKWVAAGGLGTVTEEMRVVISGCAARLVRNLSLDSYDRLTEIIVYPSSFALPNDEREILGLAHHWGTVILSWDAVRKGIAVPSDGHDTAVHEFAHALDIEDGVYDGTPKLDSRPSYHDWARVLGKHFSKLQNNPRSGVVRAYGATNKAEFFAVATEAFFEKPKSLKRRAPDLFTELEHFYNLDPSERD